MSVHSGYWRKNRSRQKALELALGLRALRKVAGHLGAEAGPVYWRGMADAADRAILLDVDSLPDRYPISTGDFDLLVGKVVQQGLASVESSDRVREEVLRRETDLPAAAVPFLNDFLEAAEDIYIDALAKPAVWSLYLAEFWGQELAGLERDPLLPPSSKSLFQVWKRRAMLDRVPEQLHFAYDAPLKILESHLLPLRALAGILSREQRREVRTRLYKTIWVEIWEVVCGWETLQPDLDTIPESQVEVAADEKPDRGEGTLAPELADEISWILEEGGVDLTREILSAMQDPEARSLETFLRKGSLLMEMQPDIAQVERLRRIFREHVAQVRRARNRKIRRGLPEGKLDPKRLYRVPIDGKTFKNRQAPGFDDFWQICIVADASASMAGKGGNLRPWRIAERTFATVIQAARSFRNRIEIYAYCGASNRCTLTRLYHGNRLHTIMPHGDTPSGQAILAVAMMLDRKYRKNMIIHITDGAPNSGLPLTDAVSYCESRGIRIFTIGCGCTPFTQQFLKESFPPGCVYLMKSIDFLSEGLETLFQQRMLRQEM